MKIINRGTVFEGIRDTDCQSCMFPHICVLPNGRWICAFRAAPSKMSMTGQHVLITWSDDDGRSWSKPTSPFMPQYVDDKPGLFRSAYLTALGGRRILGTLLWVDHSNPALPFFNEETEGLLDSRIFLSESDDAGKTWSIPKRIDTSPFNVPTTITGPVLLLPDNEMACQFELNKHYYDTAVLRHSSVMMFSKDKGKLWSEYIITSNDPENRIFYWDQRPGILANGKILNLFWTYNNRDAVYLNIHARESIDNSRNWSIMWDTGIPGQPAPPVSLRNGRIGMVYVDRTGVPIIKMRISEDNGKTWHDKTESIIYKSETESQTCNKKSMQDAWAEMSKFSIGLPATAIVQNGDVLVVYYAGYHADYTDIQWVRIRA